MRDTPLWSIYRLYELHLADRYTSIGYETEYFFYQPHWKLRYIPDPKDSDPVRYAVVACILEALHESVNWKLSLGLRRNRKHVYWESDVGNSKHNLVSLMPEMPRAWPCLASST